MPSPKYGDFIPSNWKDKEVKMSLTVTALLSLVCFALAVLNVYQFLARRGAQRLAEIL